MDNERVNEIHNLSKGEITKEKHTEQTKEINIERHKYIKK